MPVFLLIVHASCNEEELPEVNSTNTSEKIVVETLSDNPIFNDGLSVDEKGNIYASNNGANGQLTGNTIFKVDKDGIVTPFVTGLPTWPLSNNFGPDKHLYVSIWNPSLIGKVTPEGQYSVFASGITGPAGIDVGLDNSVYVSSYSASVVWKIDKEGNKSIFASGGSIQNPSALAIDDATGNLYVGNWHDGRINRINPEGLVDTFAKLPTPNSTGAASLLVLKDKLYATAYAANQIFEISLLSAKVNVLAGTGESGNLDGSAQEAQFTSPTGLAASISGDTLFVSQDPNVAVSGGGNGRLRMVIFSK